MFPRAKIMHMNWWMGRKADLLLQMLRHWQTGVNVWGQPQKGTVKYACFSGLSLQDHVLQRRHYAWYQKDRHEDLPMEICCSVHAAPICAELKLIVRVLWLKNRYMLFSVLFHKTLFSNKYIKNSWQKTWYLEGKKKKERLASALLFSLNLGYYTQVM